MVDRRVLIHDVHALIEELLPLDRVELSGQLVENGVQIGI